MSNKRPSRWKPNTDEGKITDAETSRARHDLSFWNFGLLYPTTILYENGSWELVEVEGGADYASFLPNGTLAYYSNKQGTIRMIDGIGRVGSHGKPVTVWPSESPNEISDVFFLKYDAFLLNWRRKVIIRISLESDHRSEIYFQSDAIDDTARLYVDNLDESLALAFIGPTSSGRVVVQAIGPDRSDTAASIETALNGFRELATLGERCALCSDVKHSVLFIFDELNSRLLFFNWASRSVVIRKLQVASPRSVKNSVLSKKPKCSMAYYPHRLIRSTLFDPDSQRLVALATSTSSLYSLLFSTFSGTQVLRWIEAGDVEGPTFAHGYSELNLLLGSADSEQVGGAWKPLMSQDLRDSMIKGAGHIDVSAHDGNLTVTLGEGKYVLVLQPASSHPDTKTKRIVKVHYDRS